MPKEEPLTYDEALAILKRDRFRCHYCGLDGTQSFDNALMMSVDFVVPRAEGGTKAPTNLVTACRTCNILKGRRKYASFENARDLVQAERQRRRREWEQHLKELEAAGAAESA